MYAFQQNSSEIKLSKTKLKKVWSSGDFGKIAESTKQGAVEFVERLNLKPGQRVLDVACGTGNQSIPAAQTGAHVTGVDIASNLLAQARAKAETEGLRIQFDEGDAERLPYADDSFDIVISMFGAMFVPRPDRVASELFRVCRPGGTISMANWTPTGFVGQMFRVINAYVAPDELFSPFNWGETDWVRKCFGNSVTDLKCTRRLITLSFRSEAPEVIESWRKSYGPLRKAFASLDAKDQLRLRNDLECFWAEYNTGRNGSTRIQAEYLDVKAILLPAAYKNLPKESIWNDCDVIKTVSRDD